MMLFLVTFWCCLPVNYLLSSLCNWFRLVPDWFRPVLHNTCTYCFTIAWKRLLFCICISILIQIELTQSLTNTCIILLELHMMRACLVQYFYSMNGRIQWFPVLTKWVVFCIVPCIMQPAMMAYIQCAVHFGLPSCFCKHFSSLQ